MQHIVFLVVDVEHHQIHRDKRNQLRFARCDLIYWSVHQVRETLGIGSVDAAEYANKRRQQMERAK